MTLSNAGKPLILGAGATCASALLTYIMKNHIGHALNSQSCPEVNVNNTTISIHLATLNEQDFIVPTLQTLTSQQLYKTNRNNIELVLVDSYSTDKTVELAQPYVDKILFVGKGKLTARREAIEQSLSDIIVSVDSGDLYHPCFLNYLIQPFSDPSVVAVIGSEIALPNAPVYVSIAMIWSNYVWARAFGCGMAMRRHSFLDVGCFDESIDQTDVNAMVEEEERNLYKKLSSVGRVVRAYNAVIYKSPRRFLCSTDQPGYCNQILSKGRF